MDGSSTDKARVIWGQEARRYYEYKDQHEAWQRLGVVELEMFGRVSEVTTRQIADTRERMNRALAEACYWQACQ